MYFVSSPIFDRVGVERDRLLLRVEDQDAGSRTCRAPAVPSSFFSTWYENGMSAFACWSIRDAMPFSTVLAVDRLGAVLARDVRVAGRRIVEAHLLVVGHVDLTDLTVDPEAHLVDQVHVGVEPRERLDEHQRAELLVVADVREELERAVRRASAASAVRSRSVGTGVAAPPETGDGRRDRVPVLRRGCRRRGGRARSACRSGS